MTNLDQHNKLMELIEAKKNLAVAKAALTATVRVQNDVTGPVGKAADILRGARIELEDEIALLESDIEVLQDQIKFETVGG